MTTSKQTNVVVIGGGDCGTLKEVLKHPSIEKAVQIDIDERVRVSPVDFEPVRSRPCFAAPATQSGGGAGNCPTDHN